MAMNIKIRSMEPQDIKKFPMAFEKQGWYKPEEQFKLYFKEQENGKRSVFVATVEGEIAGYATLLPCDSCGPFRNKNMPVIVDFNVLERYQRQGVGTAIMDCIEEHVKTYSNVVCLGVGLHYGYGSAQRMYIKRGYIPDGSGVWYQNERLEQYAPCVNDDDLMLYLSKSL